MAKLQQNETKKTSGNKKMAINERLSRLLLVSLKSTILSVQGVCVRDRGKMG